MRHVIFLMLLMSTALLFGCTGCDEEDMQKVDKVADAGTAATEQGEGILNSPLGLFIPPDVQGFIRLGGALFVGLATAWKQWRKKRTVLKVTKSIVQGIEDSSNGSGVKPDIETAMKANKVYREGKDLVRDLKNAA